MTSDTSFVHNVYELVGQPFTTFSTIWTPQKIVTSLCKTFSTTRTPQNIVTSVCKDIFYHKIISKHCNQRVRVFSTTCFRFQLCYRLPQLPLKVIKTRTWPIALIWWKLWILIMNTSIWTFTSPGLFSYVVRVSLLFIQSFSFLGSVIVYTNLIEFDCETSTFLLMWITLESVPGTNQY